VKRRLHLPVSALLAAASAAVGALTVVSGCLAADDVMACLVHLLGG